jgi:hypothetical protein
VAQFVDDCRADLLADLVLIGAGRLNTLLVKHDVVGSRASQNCSSLSSARRGIDPEAAAFVARLTSLLPGRSYPSVLLLQLRVLRLSGDEDRNVGVGVFPEREEILIGRLGFGVVALQHVGSADLEMR